MNWKSIYQKPIAAVKWCFKTIYKTIKALVVGIWTLIKWITNKVVAFIKWDVKQANSFIRWTGMLISTTYKFIESTLQKMGRFWIGVLIMAYGVMKASGSSKAFVAFLNGDLTPQMADGGIAYGLGMMIIGLVCVLASPDYSKITTFMEKK